MEGRGLQQKQGLRTLLNNATEIVAGVLLVVISVVVFLEVIYRYVIQAPLQWSQEVATFAFVWYCLLCAAIAVKNQMHFAIEFVVARLSATTRRILSVVVALAISGLLGVLVWAGTAMVMLNVGERSPALDLPMSVPYLSVPVGGALMLLYLWTNLVRELRR